MTSFTKALSTLFLSFVYSVFHVFSKGGGCWAVELILWVCFHMLHCCVICCLPVTLCDILFHFLFLLYPEQEYEYSIIIFIPITLNNSTSLLWCCVLLFQVCSLCLSFHYMILITIAIIIFILITLTNFTSLLWSWVLLFQLIIVLLEWRVLEFYIWRVKLISSQRNWPLGNKVSPYPSLKYSECLQD